MSAILIVGLGGFIGAILRSYINGLVNENIKHDIPFGTLSVNLLGSFLLGMLYAFFHFTHIFSLEMKHFLATGMMGALTTYSTFAVETFFLFKGKNYTMALSNMSLNLFGTIIMVAMGYRIIESFV